MPKNTTFIPVDPGVRIGHVHLKVADLDRALAFCRAVAGARSASVYPLKLVHGFPVQAIKAVE